MNIPIKKSIEKIPGGMVVIPLLLGTALNTFAPSTAEFFGGITGGYLKGASAVLFIFFVCVGASIQLHAQSSYVIKKGVALSGGKLLLALILGLVFSRILPAEGIQSGIFSGLSTLAIVTAFSQSNGGIYVATLSQYKNRESDVAAFPFISIQSGPFFTMLILGLAGASFPWPSMVSTLVPFVIGLFLGNVDEDFHKFLSPGVGIIIPFFSFALGYTLDFHMILSSGLLGVLMGVLVVFVSGGFMAGLDRYWVKSDGVAGWAAASTAGAAVSVPYVIGQSAPEFQNIAESATAIIAASAIVTAILTPIVTNAMKARAEAQGINHLPPSERGRQA